MSGTYTKAFGIKHSHTSLALFQQCRYRYFREKIVKDIPFEQNDAAKWGDEVHKAIEKFFETGDFPDFLYSYRDRIMQVAALRGDRAIEISLAVNKKWEPVKYRASDAYMRGKVDILLVRDDGVAVVVDWKTGSSKYGDKGQGGRYAAIVMSNFPDVQEVRTRFVYLKDGVVHRGEFTRAQHLDLAGEVDSITATIDEAIKCNAWPKCPGALCRKYCGVLDCEYNGRNPNI